MNCSVTTSFIWKRLFSGESMAWITSRLSILPELSERNIGQENSQGTISQKVIQTANSVIGEVALGQITPLRVKMLSESNQTSAFLFFIFKDSQWILFSLISSSLVLSAASLKIQIDVARSPWRYLSMAPINCIEQVKAITEELSLDQKIWYK